MEVLSFIVGFLGGLLIFYSLWIFISNKIDNYNFRKEMKKMKSEPIQTIKDPSDGEVIWRSDIGCCGKATHL